RDGRFVADLAPSDFEVFEDGKKMDVESVELIRFRRDAAEPAVSPDAPGAPRAPRDSRFVVVFDSINTIRRMLDRSKPEILAKLLGLLEVGREIVVFELAEDGRMVLLQPLTRDRALIARAVDKATGSIWVEKSADSLIVPSLIDGAAPSRAETPDAGDILSQSNQAVFEAETRRRFEKSINGLLGVMNIVKDLEGCKSLLFISGGVPSLSFIRFFGGAPLADTTAVQSQVAAAKIRDPFKVLGQKGFRTGSEIFDDLVRFANSHNISFYALDPDNYLRYVLGDIAFDNYPRAIGRSRVGQAGTKRPDEIAEIKRSELASLKTLADDTGGAAFLGADKFEDFARVIERDFAQYYELSYTPKRKKADGKYHKIEVKVLRPGTDVRCRPGFLDYTDDHKESLTFASAAYNPTLFTDISFEARVVPFARGRNKYRLWVQTALPVRKLVAGRESEDKPAVLKFKIVLDDPSGTSGFLTETAIPIVLAPAFLERIRNAEYFGWSCASQETEIKPGTYRATLALYNRGVDEMGAVERTVDVPALPEGGAAALLTAVVGNLVKTDKAMVVPFAMTHEDGNLDVPNYTFYPMAVARVQRGRRAGLLIQAHSPQDPKGAVLSAAAARAGGAEADAVAVPAVVVFGEWTKKTGLWNVMLDVGLESLAPADYSLGLRWTDASGAVWLEGAIPVRIL
ncbi:MAG: VWA domain-containing protein, partial [Candidatus Aminicenantes bacterium]|nr:VWA domain-containing protein [Candidatus Aminicenantes bacterium]